MEEISSCMCMCVCVLKECQKTAFFSQLLTLMQFSSLLCWDRWMEKAPQGWRCWAALQVLLCCSRQLLSRRLLMFQQLWWWLKPVTHCTAPSQNVSFFFSLFSNFLSCLCFVVDVFCNKQEKPFMKDHTNGDCRTLYKESKLNCLVGVKRPTAHLLQATSSLIAWFNHRRQFLALEAS